MPNNLLRLAAVSAIALTTGLFATSNVMAGSSAAADIVIAQAGGSGGAGGGAGSSGGGDSGRQFNTPDTPRDGRMSPPNAAPVTPPASRNAPTAGVPARCQGIADPAQRQACINTPQGSDRK